MLLERIQTQSSNPTDFVLGYQIVELVHRWAWQSQGPRPPPQWMHHAPGFLEAQRELFMDSVLSKYSQVSQFGVFDPRTYDEALLAMQAPIELFKDDPTIFALAEEAQFLTKISREDEKTP